MVLRRTVLTALVLGTLVGGASLAQGFGEGRDESPLKPLARRIAALEDQVVELRRELAALKAGGTKPVPAADGVTQLFRLQHASSDKVAELIGKLHPNLGARVVSDARTNSLLISGSPGVMEELRQLIMELDSVGKGAK